MCFNCLRRDHITKFCNAGSCRKCGYRHHSFLHYNKKPASSTDVALITIDQSKNVLLATALAFVEISPNNNQPIRILLDNCSQNSFITENCASRLGLPRVKANIPVSEIGGTSSGNTRGCVILRMKSIKDSHQTHCVQALIMNCITNTLPSSPIDKSNISFPSCLEDLRILNYSNNIRSS